MMILEVLFVQACGSLMFHNINWIPFQWLTTNLEWMRKLDPLLFPSATKNLWGMRWRWVASWVAMFKCLLLVMPSHYRTGVSLTENSSFCPDSRVPPRIKTRMTLFGQTRIWTPRALPPIAPMASRSVSRYNVSQYTMQCSRFPYIYSTLRCFPAGFLIYI